jgi:hypothetical protein
MKIEWYDAPANRQAFFNLWIESYSKLMKEYHHV